MSAIRLLAASAVVVGSTVYAAPDLSVVKSVSNATPGPDESVEFTIEVRNVGADEALDVHVIDRLPDGIAIPAGMAAAPSSGSYDPDTGDWAVGDLPAGFAQSLVIPAVVTTTTPPPCLVNAATSTDATDPGPGNNRGVAAVRRADTERCTDLKVELFGHGTEPLFCGDSRSFWASIRLINHGPDPARDVEVSIGLSSPIVPGLRFSSGLCASAVGTTCRIDELAPGPTVLLMTSDVFSNPNPRMTRMAAVISGRDHDYDDTNNQFDSPLTIPSFSACEPIDVPETFIGPGCFIASAAYGSPLHPQVGILREFRDGHLLTNAPGRTFVRAYYKHSPAIADVIARYDILRWLTRVGLGMVLIAVSHPKTTFVITGLLVWLAVGCLVQSRRRATANAVGRIARL